MEVRLTQSGISLEESRAIPGGPRFPCLGVIIHLDRVEGPLASYVFSLEVFFVQSTYRGGLHPTRSLKMTWCKEAIGDARETGQGLDWGNLYDDLGLLVDEFVQDYLTVSPHSRTARIIN